MSIALLGGTPVRDTPFPPWPQMDEREEQALLRSLRQGQWWRMHGTENDAFEKEFSEFHGAQGALTVSSGTHALEVALLTAGIGAGDEVLVPAFTFISTSMAVQRVGAIPVPVDVDLETYCIDPQAVKNAITAKTKAIIPVHMSGHFADMPALIEIAKPQNLTIIQDAAHAHGALGPGGRSAGQWGTMACFSFQNFKLMTAGEGGAILFPSQKMREKAFLFSNCGRPKGDLAYNHLVCGSNYRLGEFPAAVLRVQLERLPRQTETREQNMPILLDALKDVEGIIPQGRTDDAVLDPNYMFMFRLDPKVFSKIDRNAFVEALVAEGLPAYRAYQTLYRMPAFWVEPNPGLTEADWIAKCPASEAIANYGIWIHHRALLGTKEDVLDVANAIKKVAEHHHLLVSDAA
ncbi:MAG: 3-amino-5-hydroxybenzoic acid synthase [Rhodospirillaceae bacterium]|nr:MAG: 3-amino-5-hydroxybenzoic acid synthase [Rhodospirillaceae bacterium]